MSGFPALSDVQRTFTRRWQPLLLAWLFSLCAAAHAQSAPPPDPADADAVSAEAVGDPPSRVARLSYQAGDLGLLPAGEKDWSDASVNRPLTTGDRLSSGQGARAELDLDGGALRIAQNTDFGFLALNDQMTQVELTQGTLNVAVRQLGEGESYEIDTPTVALVIDQPGTYRVDISGDGKATRVTDFDGNAVVYGQNGAQRAVDSGSRYEFNDSGLTDVAVSGIGGGDEFDNWSSQRDQRYAQSTTRQYVSEDVVGYQDLDQYGDWQNDADYGEVWYPSQVDAGWAPYRNGHWAYIGPWGWTWVDDLPWGFAPYHYGRWVSLRGRWGWLPGPVVRRPVYAPALVAFVGGGRIGIGGPVGWFPLGPGEVYNPWYRASRGYYTRVNFTNIRERGLERAAIMDRINHHYDYFNRGQPFPNQRFINRDAPRAFSSMSAQNFVGARNVQHNLLAGDPHQFANAPVLARGVSVRPTAASFAQPRAAQARPLPSGGFSRQVVARTAPSASMLHQGPVAHAAGPAGTQPAFNNVRMLTGHGPGNLAGRPAPEAAQATPRGQSFAPPARVSNAQAGQRPEMRSGELPSSRFAHPEQAGTQATGRAAWQNRIERSEPQNNNMPRPGASFITNAQQDRERAAAQNPAAQPHELPNAPQFNRPSPESLNRPAPQEQQRFERDDNRPRPNFDAQQQQQQRQEQIQQQRNFAQPQEHFEAPQRGFQAPQQQQMQQQQHEQTHAAPQAHPEPRSAPEHHANSNDDHH